MLTTKNKEPKMATQVWPVRAISDKYITADTPAGNGDIITIRVCRGDDRVSASFCVRGDEPLNDVTVVGRLMTYQGEGIPVLDIHHVGRRWKKATKDSLDLTPAIIPELLLKDSQFVVMGEPGINNFPMGFVDADRLQPVNIPANHTHQYWLTIHIPDEAIPGRYIMRLDIAVGGEIVGQQFVDIDVLPFTLPPSRMDVGCYYRGRLHDGRVELSSELKTAYQYRQDLQVMQDHGIQYPTLYDDNPDMQHVYQAIGIRQQEQICTDPLFWTALPASNPGSSYDTRRVLLYEGMRGLEGRTIYAYAADEVNGPDLDHQSEWWPEVQKLGLKVQAAAHNMALFCEHGGLKADVACFNDELHTIDPALMQLLHDNDVTVYHYWSTCREWPETYRRRFGLAAMAAGFDGVFPYAYQHGYGASIWDDFDSGRGSDHAFAYPAHSGLISTLSFEGFAAGVTDTRYATLLESLGGEVPTELDDLDSVREAMIDGIIDRMFFN